MTMTWVYIAVGLVAFNAIAAAALYFKPLPPRRRERRHD
jgi:hypothetical protein